MNSEICAGSLLKTSGPDGATNDSRYILMRERLSCLSKEELQSIVDNIDIILFDTYNFKNGKFCPMGVALGGHYLNNPTNETIKSLIESRFQPANMLKGIEGIFYHGNDQERKKDLLSLCNELLVNK